MLRKGLAVAVILIFICLSFSPVLEASSSTDTNEKKVMNGRYGLVWFIADVQQYFITNLGEILNSFMIILYQNGRFFIHSLLEKPIGRLISFTQNRPFYFKQLFIDILGDTHLKIFNFLNSLIFRY